jgi:hypothetical protein
MMNLLNYAPLRRSEGPVEEANSGVTRLVQRVKHSMSFRTTLKSKILGDAWVDGRSGRSVGPGFTMEIVMLHAKIFISEIVEKELHNYSRKASPEYGLNEASFTIILT